ncbi:hypothetical protein PPERSA_07300 [Pseudocohnilembus persalinus]|uniref:Uncharacterized protein n=1 Tax=Pseudocohnilembus persalinus TaxID=266149 RepID=A0A0V0Q7E1_PSEPJ|nr:hypothetical protein PPERSA_07300 [Pseudocohnilembus persalinus]|eukprot:KRW98075.1 hypothetical protein PPERSA_07300 [Pseudocohnilembus persalinus]
MIVLTLNAFFITDLFESYFCDQLICHPKFDGKWVQKNILLLQGESSQFNECPENLKESIIQLTKTYCDVLNLEPNISALNVWEGLPYIVILCITNFFNFILWLQFAYFGFRLLKLSRDNKKLHIQINALMLQLKFNLGSIGESTQIDYDFNLSALKQSK